VYAYTYDKKTGGIRLNSSPAGFSKEPRPVYAAELDVLGFDRYWEYDRQIDAPYMWAEANAYWYRGVCVAKLKAGNLYTAPEVLISVDESGNPIKPELNDNALRSVDLSAMAEVNHEMLKIIEQSTVKKILTIYEKYKDRLDCFYVAFSGGKDSCVLLDLVRKTLPKGSFVVVFGDTGMEFPDTYAVIEKTREWCIREEIPFYIAKSHLDPKESWALFAPPSRVLRWCCSVHKSTPQTLKLREVTGIDDYTGLAFVGIRAQESLARSQYDYFNIGKKVKGQYDFYPILEWTSAEVWLYVFANNIKINESYKKGNSRAGCLFCPKSGGLSDYMRYSSYPNEIKTYIDLIRMTSDKTFSDSSFADFINRGAWATRGDGRYVATAQINYHEDKKDGKIVITIKNPASNWREWIKTLRGVIKYIIKETKNGYTVEIDENEIKRNLSDARILRQVFKKAAYCNACRVCESNCKNGCIIFPNGRVQISGCLHCYDCHELPGGCLRYDSLKIPYGEIKMRAINSFNDHAPKTEWIASFFESKENFLSENNLGPDQQVKFKVFLADASLTLKGHFSPFAELISDIGWETDIAQGLILINLVAGNPQIEWYVRNLDIGYSYSPQTVIDTLLSSDVKDRPSKQIVRAFKRITETLLGTTLHFGYVTDEGDLVRTKCSVTDPRVVLYGLFKFAEKCNNYKVFTLAVLLNDSIDRDGVSPTRIFGLERDEIIPMLIGLSAKYPDFITASFTHDLEKVTLASDKTSADVLVLFKGDNVNG